MSKKTLLIKTKHPTPTVNLSKKITKLQAISKLKKYFKTVTLKEDCPQIVLSRIVMI